MKPTVGIVTVLYNSDDVVEDFFASLALQSDVDFKLYVIDNSAARTALEHCRALADRLGIAAEFIFNGQNRGVAAGNNQGIGMALRDGCRYVLLSNNDTHFPAGTVAELLRALHEGELVVTPKILYHGAENLIWYAGGRIDVWTMRTPHHGKLSVDRGQYDSASYTAYASTCFLILDAGVFARVGLMDEHYFVYYDDTDFMWRLTRAGIRIRYAPSAVVYHKVSTSTGGELSPFTLYYTNRNRIYFIRKNLKGAQRLGALSYTLITRLFQSARLPSPLARRLWAGVKDGLKSPAAANAD